MAKKQHKQGGKTISLALELSSVPKGFSPPLQISHRVVPKLHLSAAKLRLAESTMHSGATQGILSIRTDSTKKIYINEKNKKESRWENTTLSAKCAT